MLTAFIFYCIFIISSKKYQISSQRIIHVDQNANKYKCYLEKTCDGSFQNPLGSLLEAINEGLKFSENEIIIKIKTPAYYINIKEVQMFSLNYFMIPVSFILRGNDDSLLTIEGAYDSLYESQTQLIFNDTLINLVLASGSLKFSNLALRFKTLEIIMEESIFLRLFGNPFFPMYPTLIFVQCEIEIENGVDNGLSLPLTFISIENENSAVKFKNISINANQNTRFIPFIISRIIFKNFDSKPLIAFDTCSFDGVYQFQTMNIILSETDLELTRTKFLNDFRLWRFEIQFSSIKINDSLFQQSFFFKSAFAPMEMFTLTMSNIEINSTVLQGNFMEMLPVAPVFTQFMFAKLLNNNRLTVVGLNISNIRLTKVFGFSNNNIIRVERFSTKNTYGTILQLDKSNTLNCSQSSFFKNQKGSVIISNTLNIVIISETSFINNSYTKDLGSFEDESCGSCLKFEERNSNIKIRKSIFKYNEAECGGCLYFGTLNKDIYIEETHFLWNMAKGNSGGGAFYFFSENSGIYLKSSVFINNLAVISDGGAILLGEYTTNFQIEASTFMGNQGIKPGKGGAISIPSMCSTIKILFCDFFSNSAFFGGVFFVGYKNSDLIFRDSVFQNNTSLTSNMNDGSGAISFYSENSGIVFDRSRFLNNFAYTGAICIGLKTKNQNVLINSTLFINNKILMQSIGSSVFLNEFNSELHVFASSFIKNKAESGGSLSIDRGNFKISFTLTGFLKNTANNGAVVTLGSLNNNILFDLTIIFDNISPSSGGALHLFYANKDMQFKNSIFKNNTSNEQGSTFVFISSNQNFSFYGVIFERNLAKEGCIGIIYENNDFFFSSTVFIENKATLSGGAIFIYIGNRNVKFESAAFISNSAIGFYANGAAFSIQENNTNITFESCTFTNNTSEWKGGTLFLSLRNSNIRLQNLRVDGDSAQNGAFMYCGLSNGPIIVFEGNISTLNSKSNGMILYSEDNSSIVLDKMSFLDVIFLGSLFHLNGNDQIQLISVIFRNFTPQYQNIPLIHLTGENTNLSVIGCSFNEIYDYIIIDDSSNTILTLKEAFFKMESKFRHEEMFFFKSENIILTFQSSKISLQNLERDLTFFSFGQRNINVSISQLEFVSSEKILYLFSFIYQSQVYIEMTYVSFRTFKGSLIDITQQASSFVDIKISNCLLVLNSSLSHFIRFSKKIQLEIWSSTVVVTNLQRFSFIYGLPEDEFSAGFLLIKKSNFKSYPIDIPIENSEFDSEFALIQAKNGFKNIFINDTTISLGKKNFRALLDLSNFESTSIFATFIYGNQLNKFSSLMVYSFSSSCLIIIEESNIRNNKAMYGGFASITFSDKLLLNSEPSSKNVQYMNLKENNITNNRASIRGGFFYLNFSKLTEKIAKNFSKTFLNLIPIILENVNEKVLSTAIKQNILFCEAPQSVLDVISNELINVRLLLKSIYNSSMSNYLLGTLITSYQVFSSSRLSSPDSESSKVYVMDEIVDRKTSSDYYFCINLRDELNQTILSNSQSELNTVFNTTNLIPFLEIPYESRRFYINFTFFRGLYCAYRFYIDNDYTSIMGKTLSIALDASKIKEFIPTINENSTKAYQIIFTVHDCKAGELYKDFQCVPCERGTYLNEKVIGSLSKCKVCKDLDYFNCYGGDMRSPKRNFWRISSHSNNFMRCPSISCLGDTDFGTNQTEGDCLDCFLPGSNKELLFYSYDENFTAMGRCKYGYRGNMCSRCIDKFGLSTSKLCSDCGTYNPYLKQVLITLFKFAFFYISCWLSIRHRFDSKSNEINSNEFTTNVLSNGLIKILIYYSSILNVLKLLPIETSVEIEEFLTSISTLSPTEEFDIFSFECILKGLSIDMPMIFFAVLTNIVFFGVSFVILVIIFKLQSKHLDITANSSKNKGTIKEIFLLLFMNNIILFLGPFSRSIVCINLGDDNNQSYFMMSDLNLSCYGELQSIFRHVISVPMLIIFVFVIPSVILYNMIKAMRNKRLLASRKFMLTYGSFTYPYKKNLIYFEIILLINKVAIIIFKQAFVFLIINNNQAFVSALLLTYLIVYYNIHRILQPFEMSKYSTLHYMESLSQKINISNTLAAIIWVLLDSNDNPLFLKILLATLLSISNLLFVITWTVVFFKARKYKFAILVFQTYKRASNRFSNFFEPTKQSSKKPESSGHQSGKGRSKSSKSQLLKDNGRMRILIELLIRQLSERNENSFGFEDEIPLEKPETIDTKLHQKINQKENDEIFLSVENYTKGVNEKASPLSINTDKNSLMSETNEKKEPKNLKKNSTELKTMPSAMKKSRNSIFKPKTGSEENIGYIHYSTKIKGEGMADHFLQLKFICKGNLQFLEYLENSNAKNDRIFFNTKVLNSKDWVVTSSIKIFKLEKLYIAVKRLAPWDDPPYTQDLFFDIEISSSIIKVSSKVDLIDFWKINSFKWKNQNSAGFNPETLVISEKIEREVLEKILAKIDKDQINHAYFGVVSISCLSNDKQPSDFGVMISNTGEINVYGTRSAKHGAIILQSIKNHLLD